MREELERARKRTALAARYMVSPTTTASVVFSSLRSRTPPSSLSLALSLSLLRICDVPDESRSAALPDRRYTRIRYE